MLTHDEVIRFFKKKPALSHPAIEKEAGLPNTTLSKAMSGQRKLNQRHLEALEPVLHQYGLNDIRTHNARVISIVNHKGGVGKTTTTINLGTALAMTGYKIMVIDMDSQGNLSQCLGIDDPEQQLFQALDKDPKPLPRVSIQDNLDLVPSNLELAKFERDLTQTPMGSLFFRSALEPLLGQYDYILIDCPPALNIFTHSALIGSSSALVVLQPEISAIKGVNNLFDLIREIRRFMNPKLTVEGILLTLVDRRLSAHKDLIQMIRDDFSDMHVFNTEIRINTALKESQIAQKSIFQYHPASTGAQDYKALANEFLQRTGA